MRWPAAPRWSADTIRATVVETSPFHAVEQVPVAGGELYVARAGCALAAAGVVVVLVHGITASHVQWRAVARRLGERTDLCLLVPDLRGRGRSAALPPSRGLGTHVEDLVALLDHAGVHRAVLVGHSMGAYVVALAAAEHPERARSVVLIDGGLPLPVPPGVDVDAALQAILGPALERLRRTFSSVEEYIAFWQAHPAFKGHWDDDLDAYVRYDLAGRRARCGAWSGRTRCARTGPPCSKTLRSPAPPSASPPLSRSCARGAACWTTTTPSSRARSWVPSPPATRTRGWRTCPT